MSADAAIHGMCMVQGWAKKRDPGWEKFQARSARSGKEQQEKIHQT